MLESRHNAWTYLLTDRCRCGEMAADVPLPAILLPRLQPTGHHLPAQLLCGRCLAALPNRLLTEVEVVIHAITLNHDTGQVLIVTRKEVSSNVRPR